jgi:transposase-like protein
MMSQSMAVVPDKDRRAVGSSMKKVYRAASAESALEALGEFVDRWDAKYPSFSRKWHSH